MGKCKKGKNYYQKRGLQRNKYLEELGLTPREYGVNFLDNKDSRFKDWKIQQAKYGFDERETWNYDTIFVEQLYSHFKMYLDVASVNLSYHTFSYGKKTLTQKQAMELICKQCEDYLLAENETKRDLTIFSAKTMTLLGKLMPTIWW